VITLVIDASVAAALTLQSQHTPAAERLLAEWGGYDPFAPYVFALELRWLFLKRERIERATGLAERALQFVDGLEIEVQDAPDVAQLDAALALAQARNIGFYDAMYIMLAADTDARLATRDVAQARVARALGVNVLDVG
jgi:predicted nucleic acid-binding protein